MHVNLRTKTKTSLTKLPVTQKQWLLNENCAYLGHNTWCQFQPWPQNCDIFVDRLKKHSFHALDSTQKHLLLSKYLLHPREQVPLSSRREVCASRQRETECSAHGSECLLDAEVLSKTISPLSLGSHALGFTGLLKREARRQSAKNLRSSRSVIGNIFSNPGTSCLIIYGMWMSFSSEDFFYFNEKHILLKISWREKFFKNFLIVQYKIQYKELNCYLIAS